jgi:hypothetical protein
MNVLTWSHHSTKATAWWMVTIAAAWFSAVVYGAEAGVFSRLYQPLIGAVVAATIVLPTLWYFLSPRVQKVVEAIGHKRIMIMHIWRVPAALMFFWYGLRGELPPVFWVLAGTGDLIAGLYAGYLSFKPESTKRYLSFHRFGFADFVVAVGTGLTHTLISDPKMAPIAVLPMALIPLFGVGISGVSHLAAFDMLRRGVGFAPKQAGVATIDQAIFWGPIT